MLSSVLVRSPEEDLKFFLMLEIKANAFYDESFMMRLLGETFCGERFMRWILSASMRWIDGKNGGFLRDSCVRHSVQPQESCVIAARCLPSATGRLSEMPVQKALRTIRHRVTLCDKRLDLAA